jgi:hypothetical protein
VIRYPSVEALKLNRLVATLGLQGASAKHQNGTSESSKLALALLFVRGSPL